MLAVEGVDTGDCRRFEPDSVVWEPEYLPYPIEWGYTGQHEPVKHVGWIDRVERQGNVIVFEGRSFDAEFDEYLGRAKRVGGSVVCDDEEYTVNMPPDFEEPVEGEPMKAYCEMLVFTRARLRAFTVLTIGAIIQAYVEPGPLAVVDVITDEGDLEETIDVATGQAVNFSASDLAPDPQDPAAAPGAPVPPAAPAEPSDSVQVTHAGVLLVAMDTSRVLMIQRDISDPEDPNAGLWEFPGGGIDEGEDPEAAARREFAEEVGSPLPASATLATSQVNNDIYELFVFTVPTEGEVNIDDSSVPNPDNPNGDKTEAVAWWDVSHIEGPMIRPEVLANPLPLLPQEETMTAAIEEPIVPDGPPVPDVPATEADTAFLEALAALARDFLDANPDSIVADLASTVVANVDASTVVANVDEMVGVEEDLLPTAEDALLASAAPVAPPDEWFQPFDLGGPAGITVTAEGQVYGHLAAWKSCHGSAEYAGQCVPPPSDPHAPKFQLGQVLTASGKLLDVGTLTVGAGHADRYGSMQAAIEHYDDASTGVAVVRIHEDEHGIGVFGSVVANATPEQVAALRRAPLSGDWRKESKRGPWRLIAGHAVVTPGYAIPRSLVASVTPTSFITTGRVCGDCGEPEEPMYLPDALVASIRPRLTATMAPVINEMRATLKARMNQEA